MNGRMETVFAVCNNIRNGITQGLSFQKLMTQIRREFKKSEIDLKIRTCKDKYLSTEVFYAQGYYDAEEDENHECPFEVIITHNFNGTEIWTRDNVTKLLIQIFDTVVHEFKHQRQHYKRKSKIRPPKSSAHIDYLADPDEVDAYSLSIAVELTRSLGKARAFRYLHNLQKLSRFKLNNQFVSPSLSMYAGTFDRTRPMILKKLAKKVYVRLQKLDSDVVFM